ncbi:MAG TPA: 5-formyltetrahydrofolate cyclo-ligase [Steroidobacteraceae bacterium]|nr:5-formyltetrahydrofolate cyclo-ligase [Steroidobacteraceae bacterium]
MAPLDPEIARTRKALRAALRAQRRALPPQERARAARSVAAQVRRHVRPRAGQRIALYAPLAEELDVAPLALQLRAAGAQLYLPRILSRRERRMRFARVRGPLRANRLGILEPAHGEMIATRSLDLVFVPLVGFDASGTRLGMGGGYYDRAFAFLELRRRWRRPKLIGLALAAQRVPSIVRAAHDVRLDAVVTEQGVLQCSTGS